MIFKNIKLIRKLNVSQNFPPIKYTLFLFAFCTIFAWDCQLITAISQVVCPLEFKSAPKIYLNNLEFLKFFEKCKNWKEIGLKIEKKLVSSTYIAQFLYKIVQTRKMILNESKVKDFITEYWWV